MHIALQVRLSENNYCLVSCDCWPHYLILPTVSGLVELQDFAEDLVARSQLIKNHLNSAKVGSARTS